MIGIDWYRLSSIIDFVDCPGLFIDKLDTFEIADPCNLAISMEDVRCILCMNYSGQLLNIDTLFKINLLIMVVLLIWTIIFLVSVMSVLTRRTCGYLQPTGSVFEHATCVEKVMGSAPIRDYVLFVVPSSKQTECS